MQELVPTGVITGQTLNTLTAETLLFQGVFSCRIKQGRIPSSAAGREGLLKTHVVREVGASSNHQREAGKITGASRPPAGSSYGNAEGRTGMHRSIPVPTLMSTSMRGLNTMGTCFSHCLSCSDCSTAQRCGFVWVRSENSAAPPNIT